jgi:acetylornithine deacetylase/succinyl-diaminopimelate desuccinylase-like protein
MGQFTDLDRWITASGNRDTFLRDLSEWRRIPAVSAESAHRDDVRAAAGRLAALAKEYGFTGARLLETGGHPAVYAERIVDPRLPTVLIYGHYDVQPAGDAALWHSDPFTPVQQRGRLVGRGTLDDGQLLMHLQALRAHLQTHGSFPVNLKLIAEGEEEIGSPNFEKLVRRNARLLAADTVVVSDTTMLKRGVPSMSISLRGLVYFEMTVDGPDHELHSGEAGGAVENVLNATSAIQSALMDPFTKEVKVPGFYDGVVVTPEMRESLRRLPISARELKRSFGNVPGLIGATPAETLERVAFRPTMEFNGLAGGYQGEGAKTIIPSRAVLKFSTRLVAGQDPAKISAAVIKHVQDTARKLPGVRVHVRELSRGAPVAIDPTHPAVQAAAQSMKEVFGKDVAFTGEGGSIPPVTVMQDVLGAPAVLIGMGLPDGRMHGPDENIPISQLQKGVRVLARFYERVGQQISTKQRSGTALG